MNLINPNSTEYKIRFFEIVKALSDKSDKALFEEAVKLYAEQISLPFDKSIKWEKSLVAFSRIMAMTKIISSVSGEGIYTFCYTSKSEEFTFLDTFPMLHIFDPEHFTDSSGSFVSGINLNRLTTNDRISYLKDMEGETNLKKKQEIAYAYITRLAKSKLRNPFRKFSTNNIDNLRKVNIKKSLTTYDISWIAGFERYK